MILVLKEARRETDRGALGKAFTLPSWTCHLADSDICRAVALSPFVGQHKTGP